MVGWWWWCANSFSSNLIDIVVELGLWQSIFLETDKYVINKLTFIVTRGQGPNGGGGGGVMWGCAYLHLILCYWNRQTGMCLQKWCLGKEHEHLMMLREDARGIKVEDKCFCNPWTPAVDRLREGRTVQLMMFLKDLL